MSGRHARCFGAGGPPLLIHGLGVTGEMFRPVEVALAAQHHLLVPGLASHGDTGRLPGPNGPERQADELVRLLDRRGPGATHALGCSMGGAVALVLAASFAGATGTLSERLQLAALGAALRPLAPARVAGLFLAGNAGRRGSEEDIALSRRMMSGQRREELPEARHALRGFDGRGWLGGIGRPALVVAGGVDPSATPARLRARGSPAARLPVPADAGHMFIASQAADLAAAVLDHLRSGSLPGEAAA
jgi:pimeloyl-ACP methyl ester carboxylesterase